MPTSLKTYIGSMPCIPARRELHTGRYNFLHRSWWPLQPFDDSMPEILKKHGTHSHLVTDHQHYGEDSGGGSCRRQDMGASCGRPCPRFPGTRRGRDPFVLAVPFDEPHDPFVAPPEYWEQVETDGIPKPPNFNAPVDNKPFLQRVQREQNGEEDWESYAQSLTHFYGCNRYIDREIGRVMDAIDNQHREDTVIIYTSDHGDMLRAYGLLSKGPMMYEEITNIPFIVRIPDGQQNAVRHELVNHLDILPTVLDFGGIDIPKSLQGTSMKT